jgi:biopolymer transport protein TolQ
MGHVENAVQRGVARTMVKYEDKMVLLSSLVSGGPFLGLLGTVWGVMVTFGALTEKASIAQLAPGVCGALVTTTLGLLVAIPATFGYNYLLTQVKIMTTELENFASSLADRVELELEGEARRNFEAAQEREQLRRAAQAAQPTAAAPVAEVPPAALPGWEDAQ